MEFKSIKFAVVVEVVKMVLVAACCERGPERIHALYLHVSYAYQSRNTLNVKIKPCTELVNKRPMLHMQ